MHIMSHTTERMVNAMRKNYAGDMTSPEFASVIQTCKAILIPIGSCEQHGHHMPLDTDNIIGTYLAMETAKRCNCLVMPSINYGQVWSARKFSGTIALSNDTLIRLIKDIVLSLESHHAKNIILFAGHNGNSAAIKEAARQLLDEYQYENVWTVTADVDKSLMKLMETPIPCGCVHAGEMETSMLLAIRPDLVHMDLATAEFPELPEAAKYRPISWDHYIKSGSFGDGSKATIEKGKALLESAIQNAVHLINDIIPD